MVTVRVLMSVLNDLMPFSKRMFFCTFCSQFLHSNCSTLKMAVRRSLADRLTIETVNIKKKDNKIRSIGLIVKGYKCFLNF